MLEKKATRKEITDVICKTLAVKYGLDLAKLSDGTNLQHDLDIDSIDKVELILELEDQYDMSISDDDAAYFKTIGDLSDYTFRHQRTNG